MGLALGLAAAALACGPKAPPPPVERVILVGVDGLEWRVVDRMLAQHRLPHLQAFIERGVRAELITLAPAYSPTIWTSIATGKLPQKHGITGFTAPDATGRQLPFTSNQRTARTVWDILGGEGRRVAVVGWWTTWPAEPVNGALVSDRMLYNRFNLWFGLPRAAEELPLQTYPPELFERLRDTTHERPGLDEEFFTRFQAGRERPPMQASLHDPWYELWLVYERDRAYATMLDRLLGSGSYDFVAYYVNGPDIASHYFWKYLFPEDWPDGVAAEDVARYGEVIPRYYDYVDEVIGPHLAQASEHCLVVVLSDHGFKAGKRPETPTISGEHHWSAPPGVLILAGGGLPAATRLARATVLDIAPTLLFALGHPVPRDMDGQVLPVVVAAAGGRQVVEVASYERSAVPGTPGPVPTPYDESILERLRALGYVGTDGATRP